jgi:hypothetical protein
VLNIVVAALRAAGPQLSAHQVRLIGLTRICGRPTVEFWDAAVVATVWSRIGSVRLLQHRHCLSWEASLSFRESALWPVLPGAESRTPQAPLVSVGSLGLRDAGGRHRSRSAPRLRLVGILARIRSIRPVAAAERSASRAGTRRWSKPRIGSPVRPSVVRTFQGQFRRSEAFPLARPGRSDPEAVRGRLHAALLALVLLHVLRLGNRSQALPSPCEKSGSREHRPRGPVVSGEPLSGHSTATRQVAPRLPAHAGQ